MASMLPGSPLVQDICAAAVTAGVALGLLRFWEEVAKRRVFEQVLTSISLLFCFPLLKVSILISVDDIYLILV